jgi:hypothetical protein
MGFGEERKRRKRERERDKRLHSHFALNNQNRHQARQLRYITRPFTVQSMCPNCIGVWVQIPALDSKEKTLKRFKFFPLVSESNEP